MCLTQSRKKTVGFIRMESDIDTIILQGIITRGCLTNRGPMCLTERIDIMEKMSKKEQEMLHALQAKAKRVQRAEAEFLREADAKKEELLERWGLSDTRKYSVPAENLDHHENVESNV